MVVIRRIRFGWVLLFLSVTGMGFYGWMVQGKLFRILSSGIRMVLLTGKWDGIGEFRVDWRSLVAVWTLQLRRLWGNMTSRGMGGLDSRRVGCIFPARAVGN
jgi:hypothetical protein